MTTLSNDSTKQEWGLFGKFYVARTDGRDRPGGDKADARYFVLDYVNDPLARWTLKDYADRAWLAGYEALAEDLWAQLRDIGLDFETIPEKIARGKRTVKQVRARMIEPYGPDEDKWPRFPSEGR